MAGSHAILTVFKTLGQHVAVLQNGEREAGYHEAQFDASALASGGYLYLLTPICRPDELRPSIHGTYPAQSDISEVRDSLA